MNKFTEPFQNISYGSIFMNLFSYRYPYLWILIGIILSIVIILNRPNIIDNKSNNKSK